MSGKFFFLSVQFSGIKSLFRNGEVLPKGKGAFSEVHGAGGREVLFPCAVRCFSF